MDPRRRRSGPPPNSPGDGDTKYCHFEPADDRLTHESPDWVAVDREMFRAVPRGLVRGTARSPGNESPV
jgi:hypothetical protein